MPRNSTGTIAVNVDVDTYTASKNAGEPTASGRYEFSPQDGTVRFRQIPAAGTNQVGLLLVLPDDPSDGDTYDFLDADGSLILGTSLAVTHAIIVIIADAGATGRTFGGSGIPANPPLSATPVVGLVTAFSGGSFQFDSEANQWLFFQGTGPLFNAQKQQATTGNAPITPTNFAGGAATNLLAFLINPAAGTGLGLYALRAMLLGTLSAADADYEIQVEIIPNVTAFSGGTLIGAAPALQIRYNGGGAVVVTGDAPTVCQGTKQQVAAGNIAAVMSTINELLTIPAPTLAGALGTAVVLLIKTAAATVTAMSMSASLNLVE